MTKTRIKKPRFRWPITIGLILGTVIVIAFAFLYKLPAHSRGESAEDSKQKTNKEFISVTTVNKKGDSPYQRTGLDNVYFTISEDGKVSYYEFAKERFNSLKATDRITVSLTVGKEKVHVDISLIKKNNQTVGYGLYSDPESVSCPYLFLKLTDNTIVDSEYKYLIFADSDYKNLYSNNKTYQMIYALNPEKKSVKRLLSDQGQPVGRNGLPSTSFIIVPDEFAGTQTDAFYFLSDRNSKSSATYELYKKADLDSPEEFVCDGICKPNLISYKGDTYFFKNSEDGEGYFSLYKCTSSGVKQIKRFDEEADKCYVRDAYLLSCADKVLYDLFSNEEIGIPVPVSIRGIEDFVVNEKQDKIAIVGSFAGNSEKILFSRLGSPNYKEKYKIFDNRNLFISGHSNVAFMGDYIYLVAPSEDEDKVYNYVISWDAIFSL